VPNLVEDQYMDQLKVCARSNGIDVPLTANAPNMVSFSYSATVLANVGRTLCHGRKTTLMLQGMLTWWDFTAIRHVRV
jgi:hypothetical protein